MSIQFFVEWTDGSYTIYGQTPLTVRACAVHSVLSIEFSISKGATNNEDNYAHLSDVYSFVFHQTEETTDFHPVDHYNLLKPIFPEKTVTIECDYSEHNRTAISKATNNDGDLDFIISCHHGTKKPNLKKEYSPWTDIAYHWGQPPAAAQVWGPGSDGGLPSSVAKAGKIRDAIPDTATKLVCPHQSEKHICSQYATIWTLVQHLNDAHRWTREAIADWLEETAEENNLDLSFPTPEDPDD